MRFLKLLILTLSVVVQVFSDKITFKNVEISLYSHNRFLATKNVINNNNLVVVLNQFDRPYDVVKIKGQNIPVLYKNSFSHIHLHDLTIDDCDLEKIEIGAFDNVQKLIYLTITNTKLTELERGVFYGLPLFSLNLQSNGIKNVENGAFQGKYLFFIT